MAEDFLIATTECPHCHQKFEQGSSTTNDSARFYTAVELANHLYNAHGICVDPDLVAQTYKFTFDSTCKKPNPVLSNGRSRLRFTNVLHFLTSGRNPVE